jgi:putative tricarboxylic transport membrane protein
MLFTQSAGVVYALYAGLLVAIISQLFIGMAMMPACIWLVNRPRPYLNAFIFALVMSGIYSIHNSLFDLSVMLVAGAVGFFMRILKFPFLPTVLGLVLGFMIESNFRRSLVLSGDDPGIFIEDGISLALLSVAALFVLGSLGRRFFDMITGRRHGTYQEGSES